MSTNIKIIKNILQWSLLLLVGLVAFMWLKPMPEFDHDKARNLPWQLPDYRAAKSQVEILDDGRIHIQIEHLPLVNITPKMVSYFYQVLPITQVSLNGEVMPLYHIFHPTEHGQIEIKEPGTNRVEGMSEGALVYRQEWFGPFNSKGTGRIVKKTDTVMVAQPEMMGLKFGRITHSFEKTHYGTRYTLDSIVGSDLPIIGPLINYYIRHKMFTPEMVEQWLRHQIQEVSSLQFFARELYQARNETELAGNVFRFNVKTIE